ncbi:hypothetical protein STSP2_01296 [Anaerohalosphaera lusitana]|uniref:Uncharacterized protein n=1 Tax=Anaerohalosphaera lusitana TaxID=1936003 RepID=A0A1U9NJP3_9BACT|nr:hypothetical protein [Anaerohalosphaera lusitana]AQT68141.1 hypothetical protein STSP2_01296 [Anaerohalosphaera lusitana]
MKKGRKRTSLILLAAILLAISAHRALKNFQIQQETTRWYAKAITAFNDETTPEDARDWLTDNGFELMIWNPNAQKGWIGKQTVQQPDSTSDYYLVQGSKPLSEDIWLDIKFTFDTDLIPQKARYNTRTHPINSSQSISQ